MTDRSSRRPNFPIQCFLGTVSMIVVLVLSGCGREKTLSESDVLHIIEIPHPHDVTSIYGDEWPNVLKSYVRDDEYTVVLIANHEEGREVAFPPSMNRWDRSDAHDQLVYRMEQAAAAAAVSGQYRERLYQLIQDAASEDSLLIRHSVIGGVSTLQVYADQAASRLEQLSDETGPIQSRPAIDSPAAWSTILGKWVFWILLITTAIGLGYFWHYLGRRADESRQSLDKPSAQTPVTWS